MNGYTVRAVKRGEFEWLLLNHHYARRVPSISHAFGLFDQSSIIGVVTFGTPASRHMQTGANPSDPGKVTELNRLCVLDEAPRNTETWFLSQALRLMPPMIILSYADTAQGHRGFVYRAANFFYAGWTDMDRKTARFDYVVPGKHSRQAFRDGVAQFSQKVRRKPKVRYWTSTGDRRQRRALEKACRWPILDWKIYPPPMEHMKFTHVANDNVPPAAEQAA